MRRKLIPVMAVLLLDAGLGLAEPPAPMAAGPVTSDGGACSSGAYAGWATDHGAAVPADTIRVSAEYILWTVRGNVPPDMQTVISGSALNNVALQSWRSGFRAFASYAPADDFWPGIEVGGFFLEPTHGHFDATTLTHPGANPSAIPKALILQPVVGGSIQVPDSTGIVDTPLLADLDASDMLTSHLGGTSQRKLWGLEANLRSGSCCFGGLRFDALAGFRYIDLREKLTVQGDFAFAEPGAGGDPDETPDNPEDGRTNTMHTFDTIAVRNNFYGGQIGTSFEAWLCDCLVISGFAKVALGGNWEQVRLSGTTILDPALIEPSVGATAIPRAGAVLQGGLFTPQANASVTKTTHLCVMPDLNINVGYQMAQGVQVYVGYNYLYMSNVARLGSQSAVAGTSGQGHLNLHGADFGVQFRY